MSQLYCWRCLQLGIKTPLPLFKVRNSWVFACGAHQHLEVPDEAYSAIEEPSDVPGVSAQSNPDDSVKK